LCAISTRRACALERRAARRAARRSRSEQQPSWPVSAPRGAANVPTAARAPPPLMLPLRPLFPKSIFLLFCFILFYKNKRFSFLFIK